MVDVKGADVGVATRDGHDDIVVEADGPDAGPEATEPGHGGGTTAPAEGAIGAGGRVALLVTLVVDAVLAAAIAALDVDYGEGVGHLVGLGLWIAVAMLNAVAVVYVARRHANGYPSALLAQIFAVLLGAYVLLASAQSPDPDPSVATTAAVVATAGAWWIVYLLVKAPLTSRRTFSASWKVVSASFALMSLFSLWVTTSYLPSTQRPMVDLSTSLTEVSHNDTTTILKATITLHNRGQAAAVIAGSLYRIHWQAATPLPPTGNVSIDDFRGVRTHEEEIEQQDELLKQAFDFTRPNTRAYVATSNVLEADEIAPMREILLPGQTWSTESVVRAPTAFGATVRLTAQISLITERYLGDTRPCFDPEPTHLDAGFIESAGVVGTVRATAAPTADPLHVLCVETAIAPQSAVQDLVGNRPTFRTYYILSGDNGDNFERVPALVTAFRSSSDDGAVDDAVDDADDADDAVDDEDGGIGDARKIDAKNPTAVIETRSELGILGAPTKTGP